MVRSRPSNRPRSSGCDRLWSHSPNVVASQKRCKRLGAQARGVMLRGGGDSLGDHLLGLTVLPGSGRDRPVVPLDLVLGVPVAVRRPTRSAPTETTRNEPGLAAGRQMYLAAAPYLRSRPRVPRRCWWQ